MQLFGLFLQISLNSIAFNSKKGQKDKMAINGSEIPPP